MENWLKLTVDSLKESIGVAFVWREGRLITKENRRVRVELTPGGTGGLWCGSMCT